MASALIVASCVSCALPWVGDVVNLPKSHCTIRSASGGCCGFLGCRWPYRRFLYEKSALTVGTLVREDSCDYWYVGDLKINCFLVGPAVTVDRGG